MAMVKLNCSENQTQTCKDKKNRGREDRERLEEYRRRWRKIWSEYCISIYEIIKQNKLNNKNKIIQNKMFIYTHSEVYVLVGSEQSQINKKS